MSTTQTKPIQTRYIVSLDLGQTNDYSALVVDAQTATPNPNPKLRPDLRHDIRHIQRWPLLTSYVDIVKDTVTLFDQPPLRGALLLVDRTGVGRGIYDMLARSGIKANVIGWSITAGRKPNFQDKTVPKSDLCASIKAALSTRRLHIAPTLDLARTLTEELANFHVTVTEDRNETFASWREKDHDDILLSTALCVWWGELLGPPGGGAWTPQSSSGGPQSPVGFIGQKNARGRGVRPPIITGFGPL
jgi:hypothetical protein